MTMTPVQSWIFFGIIALCTLLTRALPFLLFPAGRKTPDYVLYLGRVLPYTIIGMLVVYCLKDVNFLAAPFGLPEILGVGLTALLHIWKKNTLLSVGAGTLFYMILVQVVF